MSVHRAEFCLTGFCHCWEFIIVLFIDSLVFFQVRPLLNLHIEKKFTTLFRDSYTSDFLAFITLTHPSSSLLNEVEVVDFHFGPNLSRNATLW